MNLYMYFHEQYNSEFIVIVTCLREFYNAEVTNNYQWPKGDNQIICLIKNSEGGTC